MPFSTARRTPRRGRPTRRSRSSSDASGAVISYGLPLSFFITFALSLGCAAVAAYALRALSATVGLGPFAGILNRLPPNPRLDDLVSDLPIVWAIGAAVIGSFLALYWVTRVRRVTITRKAVFIARGLRPLPRRYPRPPYGRGVPMEKGVDLGKLGSNSLLNASASPVLRSEDEARWVAAEMRRALR